MTTWAQIDLQQVPAAAWLRRLVASLRGRLQPVERSMRHVETLSLGPKQSLHLVEYEGRRYLIAAGDLSTPVPVDAPTDAQHREAQ